MPTDSITDDVAAERRAFYAALRARNMAPLWEVLRGLVTPEPKSPMRPAHWRYGEVRPEISRAGELITAAEAERRVLILENPAAQGQSRITGTLYAGLQLILPGEVAPAHRHTQSALRFVMEGEGAFTALDGRRAVMRRFDLVLTPNWIWHDHGNETQAPMVWLDGLDIPLIATLDASFAEHREGAFPRANDVDFAGTGDVRRSRYRPTAPGAAAAAEPTFIYPYAEWRASLAELAERHAPDPQDGFRLEFVNPSDGGPVLATISAFAQLVPGGTATRPVRSTDGTVFVVVEGVGDAQLGETRFALAPGDIFVAPSWTPRAFTAHADLVLFSYSDQATQQKLGLWRRS